MAAVYDEAMSCNNLTPWKLIAGDGLRNISLIYEGHCLCKTWHLQIYSLVRQYSRTLICKENYIHYLIDAHGAFCYARSFASFGCPYFGLYLSLGLVKVNPRLIACDDICERSIVVFMELFQRLLCDSYPSKFLFFCNEMG